MKYYNCPDALINSNYEELITKGYYFKSENDISTTYLIKVKEVSQNEKAIIEIYSTGSIQPDDPEIFIGEQVGTHDDLTLLCVLDLRGKYFFTNYVNQPLQNYYDGKEYYSSNENTDSVIALAEAVNYSIKIGLKIASIKPY